MVALIDSSHHPYTFTHASYCPQAPCSPPPLFLSIVTHPPSPPHPIPQACSNGLHSPRAITYNVVRVVQREPTNIQRHVPVSEQNRANWLFKVM